jgi:hypothetical protein
MKILIMKILISLLAISIYRFLIAKNLIEMFDMIRIYNIMQNILVGILACCAFDSVNKNNDSVVEPVVEHTINRVVERAKCRDIVVEDQEVKIKFLNGEDAEIFAGDLKNLLNEKE